MSLATTLDFDSLRDVNSARGKFATIIPSTNLTVEHDFHDINPRGVTFPVGRMLIAEPRSRNDDEFSDIIRQVDETLADAIRVVMTTEPDYLLMAMSAPAFWGGVEGNQRLERRIKELSGLDGVTTGPTAVLEGLKLLNVKRLSFITPYQPIGDSHVGNFFRECGFEVKREFGFKVPSIDKIGRVPTTQLIEALREVDGPDVDAIVQAGTNLSMIRLADEAERWLGKPVITINAATLWHGLRSFGINDRFEGFGTLLRDF